MMKYLEIPYFEFKLPAGFPSPAQDWIEQRIDLNDLLIRSPSSTFLFRASGESMVGAGILDGSLLLVDRAVSVRSDQIVVASLGGEFTVKRYLQEKGRLLLRAENPEYKDIAFTEETSIWGVVIAVITKCMP